MKTKKILLDLNAHIANIACEIKVDGDALKALISFDNLGYGVVTAVKFNATGFNSFGDVVQIGGKDKFFLIIQDIRIEKNSSAKNLKATLPNSDIRRLELEECQICYADGSVTSYDGKDVREYDVDAFEEYGSDKESIEAIKDIVSAEAKYVPLDIDKGWLCSCGRFNTVERSKCSKCGVKKQDIFKITEPDYIADLITKHRKNEKDRQEKAQQEAKEKEKATKNRKIKIGIGVIIGIILAIIICRATVMSGRSTFDSVSAMKTALQGTYTIYDGINAKYKIHIDGDTVYERWCSLGSDSDLNFKVTSWNYKNGTIDTSYKSIVVTSSGDIKYHGKIYKKGGSWSSTAAGSSYSSGYSSSNNYENGYTVLKITVDGVTSNSGYTICTGSVKNNGTKTYKYIQVKGSFKDYSGNVVDTDWTYAAGSEGLAPGESTTFRLSVTKNSNITSCSVSLLNYD